MPVGVATAVYLAFHAGLRPQLSRAGRAVLLLGWVVQTLDIGIRCVHAQQSLLQFGVGSELAG